MPNKPANTDDQRMIRFCGRMAVAFLALLVMLAGARVLLAATAPASSTETRAAIRALDPEKQPQEL